MVAVAPINSNNVPPELTPKQKKRLEEQKAREVKKMNKRQEKALQRERKAAEKEVKREQRQRKMEEERMEQEMMTPKEEEEAKRRMEEKELFETEFGILENDDFSSAPQAHVKKSVFDSNRLGGTHMA